VYSFNLLVYLSDVNPPDALIIHFAKILSQSVTILKPSVFKIDLKDCRSLVSLCAQVANRQIDSLKSGFDGDFMDLDALLRTIYDYLYWVYNSKHEVTIEGEDQEPVLSSLVARVLKFAMALDDTSSKACMSVVVSATGFALYLVNCEFASTLFNEEARSCMSRKFVVIITRVLVIFKPSPLYKV
jgi:hypothetical protein